MIKELLARAHQKHRTTAWPAGELPALSARFRGLPALDESKCAEGCRACAEACPTDAIAFDAQAPAGDRLRLDLARCLFCPECEAACPAGALHFTPEHRLAACAPGDLVVSTSHTLKRAEAMGEELRRLLGRSLKLRQVSAGGCNGCEADVNVLTTIVWDIGRFGIQIVASPRHADGLIVTGPVTQNMRLALEKTYAAVPDPKIVIAVGACALSGGPFAGLPEQHGGAASTVPVDLLVPGCPPHPLTILDGLLRVVGRLDPER